MFVRGPNLQKRRLRPPHSIPLTRHLLWFFKHGYVRLQRQKQTR
jgi:hypothetical protein